MAIHMNRAINDGYAYNKQIDMLPLFGGADCKPGDFMKLVAKEAGVQVEDIYGSDLYLYIVQRHLSGELTMNLFQANI